MKIAITFFITAFVFVALIAYLISENPAITNLQQNDFRAQYTAAVMSSHGVRNNMYDMQTQLYWEHREFPMITRIAQVMPYNRIPLNAFLITPLARFSYTWAYRVSIIFNLGLILWAYYLTYRSLLTTGDTRLSSSIMYLFPLFIPFWIAILQTQFSFIIYLSVYWLWRLDHEGRDYAAGLSTWALLIAPHIWGLVAIALLVRRKYKIVLGMMCAGASHVAITSAIYGPRIWVSYIQLLLKLSNIGDANAIHPSHEATLRGAVLSLAHTEFMNIYTTCIWIAAVALLLYALRYNSRLSTHGLDLWYASVILFTILASPHLNLHDYSLLFLAITLSARQIVTYRKWYPRMYQVLTRGSYLYLFLAIGIIVFGLMISMNPPLTAFIVCCMYLGLYRMTRHTDIST